jgi:hypothetical protein
VGGQRKAQLPAHIHVNVMQIQDIKTAFGKGADKDKKDDKKDEKKDDKKDDKKGDTGRAGPLYDPDDSMGAVLMGDKLEEVHC